MSAKAAPFAFTAAFALSVMGIGNAGAQSAVSGVPNAVQGFSQNRDQPMQIDAATLEMCDRKKEAIFAGNVRVVLTQCQNVALGDRLLVPPKPK